MLNFIKHLIDDDLETWREMQHEEKIMLERGINTPEREKELWYFQTYGLAIIKTLEEFKKEMYEKKDKEFYSFIIYKKHMKSQDGLKEWDSFYTYKKILVKGEENRGKQEKSLGVIFDGIDTKNLSSGFLVVRREDLIQPKIWEIVDGPNGQKWYPKIKVKEIYSFDPLPELED